MSPTEKESSRNPEKQQSHRKNDTTLFLKENAEQLHLVLIKSANNFIRAKYAPNQLKDTTICSVAAGLYSTLAISLALVPPLGSQKTLGSVNYGISTTGGISHYLRCFTYKPVSMHSKDTNPEATHALSNKMMVGNTVAPTFSCLQQEHGGRK